MAQIRFEDVVVELVNLLPDAGSTVTMDQLAEAAAEVLLRTKEEARQWLYGQTTGRQSRYKVIADILGLKVEAGQRGRRIDLTELKAKVAAARQQKKKAAKK